MRQINQVKRRETLHAGCGVRLAFWTFAVTKQPAVSGPVLGWRNAAAL